MYHSCTLLQDNSIVVIGGRNSPLQANKHVYKLKFFEKVGEWEIIRPHKLSDRIEPRWRHSATAIEFLGKSIFFNIMKVHTHQKIIWSKYFQM